MDTINETVRLNTAFRAVDAVISNSVIDVRTPVNSRLLNPCIFRVFEDERLRLVILIWLANTPITPLTVLVILPILSAAAAPFRDAVPVLPPVNCLIDASVTVNTGDVERFPIHPRIVVPSVVTAADANRVYSLMVTVSQKPAAIETDWLLTSFLTKLYEDSLPEGCLLHKSVN